MCEAIEIHQKDVIGVKMLQWWVAWIFDLQCVFDNTVVGSVLS